MMYVKKKRIPANGFIYVVAKWRGNKLIVHCKKNLFAKEITFYGKSGATYLYNKKELLETKREKDDFIIKTTSKAAKQLYELTFKRGVGYSVKIRADDPLYKMALKHGDNKYSKHIL